MIRTVQVQNLRPGNYVDLEGDPYAPEDEDQRFEYAEVESVEVESPECVVVHFLNFPSVGFPIGHTVLVEQ